MSPFVFINAINNKTEIKITSEYNQFLTTRFFSLFKDTIYIANEANMFKNVGNLSHFKYYYNLVSKGKRFTKWPKGIEDEVVKMVALYNDFSLEKARTVINILNEEQLQEIKNWYDEKYNI